MIDNSQHFLQIRLEGDAIGTARVPVSHLLRLLTQLQKVLQRAGMVLTGESYSLRVGARQVSIKDEIALDLVQITQGSQATILGFERGKTEPCLPNMDLGLDIIEKTIEGLTQIQQPGDSLPVGFDTGVLLAWRDIGILFEQGVSEIRFTLNNRPKPLITSYTKTGYHHVQQRIAKPQMNMRKIEGRLLMADFKENGTRCRIHPSTGDPVLCLFDESQKDEVLESILHYVYIIGEAKEDPMTGKIAAIKIADIKRLDDREYERTDLLPQGIPLPVDFWQSPTIEELAASQGVVPIQDVTALFGTWPGESDDGFEESIINLRESNLIGGIRS
jgi:hypothetical protein